MRLAAEKRAGVARINAMADAVRRRFITPIIGQEMIYIEKETEARRFIAMETLPNDLTDFPFIASEVGVTAPSAYEVAQLYLNLGAQWRVVGSQLENLRLSSITAIESATTLSQITQTIAYAEQVIQSFQ
ncbi:MAG: hypothetical protein LPK02_07605 [Rhodobacterales bacterium]|nr:hypothetical protein [Rhodobacterales bacterium]